MTMKARVAAGEARAPTPDEARWFRRLKRCLADIPRNVEIIVGPFGQVRLHERGAREETVRLHDCADRTPEMDFFQGKRIRGEESSV